VLKNFRIITCFASQPDITKFRAAKSDKAKDYFIASGCQNAPMAVASDHVAGGHALD